MSDLSPTEHPLARKTVAAVRDALASGRVPVVTHVMELVRAITTQADTVSLQHLADIISRDPATMARIISIANKLGYNRSGAEIVTIQQAISTVGFERIRSLAFSVMLLQNEESQLAAEENQEVAGLSLASGFLAAELMRASGLVDPDLVFVCAALRSYGRMLMTTFLLEQYQQARRLSSKLGTDAACREVFGLTPLELGRELLGSEQLPHIILDSMREFPREAIGKVEFSPIEQLISTAEFSVRLLELFEAPDLTRENFGARAVVVARKHLVGRKLSASEILEHLKEVDQRCAEIAGGRNIHELSTPLFRRIEALAEGRPLPPPSGASRRGDHGSAAAILQGGGDEIGRLIEAGATSLDRLFFLLMRTLEDGLHLQQTVVFLRGAGTGALLARYGQGRVFEALQGRPVLDERHHDVFGLCLSRGEDALIEDTNDAKLRPFLPSWLCDAAKGAQVILLALKDETGTFGLVLGISRSPEACDLARKVAPELRDLRIRLGPIGPAIRAGRE